MMYKFRNSIFLTVVVAVIIFFASACKDKAKGDIQSFIPADAAGVAIINIDRLGGKMDVEQVRKNMFIQFMEMQLTQQNIPNFIKNRKIIGLDFTQNIYVILPADQKGIMKVVAEIRDEEDFEIFVKAVTQSHEVAEEDDISFISGNNLFITWRDDIAVIASGEVPQEQMRSEIMAMYTAEPKNSLFEDDRFSSFVDEEYDIAFWMDNENFQNFVPKDKMRMEPSEQMKKLQKDAVTAFRLNFDKGEVHINIAAFVNDEAAKYYSNMFSDQFDESLLNYIPDENIAAFMSMAFDPQLIKDLIQQANVQLDSTGVEATTDGGKETKDLKKIYFRFQNLLDMVKGDAFIAFTGMQANPDTTAKAKAIPAIFGVMNVQSGWSDSIAAWGDSIIVKKEDFHTTKDEKIFLFFRDGRGFVTNSKTYLMQVKNAEGANGVDVEEEITAMAKAYPFVVYVDMEKLSRSIAAADDKNLSSTMQMLSQHISTLEITADKISGNKMTGDIYLRMKNKDVSSLQALIDLAMSISGNLGQPSLSL